MFGLALLLWPNNVVLADKHLSDEDSVVCEMATTGGGVKWSSYYTVYVEEAKRRGLDCGVAQLSFDEKKALEKALEKIKEEKFKEFISKKKKDEERRAEEKRAEENRLAKITEARERAEKKEAEAELVRQRVFDNCIIDKMPVGATGSLERAVINECRKISKNPSFLDKLRY